MVPHDYQSYGQIYTNIISNHIHRQYQKYISKHPYIIKGPKTDNFNELIFQFVKNLGRRYIKTDLSGIINESDETNAYAYHIISSSEFIERYELIFRIINFIMSEYIACNALPKDRLYEFTNYIIHDFKIDDELQNKIFTNIPNVETGIDEALTHVPQNKTFSPNNIVVWDERGIELYVTRDRELKNYPTKDRIKSITLTYVSLCKLIEPYMNFHYNYGMRYTPLQQPNPPESIESFLNNLQSKSSMSSMFSEVLNNRELIHKTVLDAIKRNDIILLKSATISLLPKSLDDIFLSKRELKERRRCFYYIDPTHGYKFYFLSGIPETEILLRLLNYLLKTICCTDNIYEFKHSNVECNKLKYDILCKYFSDINPNFINILKGEYNFIKKELKYGNLDENNREVILIFDSFIK